MNLLFFLLESLKDGREREHIVLTGIIIPWGSINGLSTGDGKGTQRSDSQFSLSAKNSQTIK
jgi:hypothetical protein